MKEASELGVANETNISQLELANGLDVELFIPEKYRDRIPFENDLCEFTPVGWVRVSGIWYPLGYKVVTDTLESLGLRNNPNIMTFPVGSWVEVDDNDLEAGMGDWGGIWTALRKSSIKTLTKHCETTWGMTTRGFLTAISYPVFANSYRIKSQGVMLIKEILP